MLTTVHPSGVQSRSVHPHDVRQLRTARVYPITAEVIEVPRRLSPEAQRALANFLTILEREWRS